MTKESSSCATGTQVSAGYPKKNDTGAPTGTRDPPTDAHQSPHTPNTRVSNQASTDESK